MTRFLLLVAMFLVATTAAHADWPSFRGPGHQGHAGKGDYPERWGPDENVAWKVRLPGPGASSPVIQGDRVFVTCFTGTKAKDIVRILMCLERKTGKILWEQKRPATQPENDYTGHLLQHGRHGTPIGRRSRLRQFAAAASLRSTRRQRIWHRELGKFLHSFGSVEPDDSRRPASC